TITIKLARLWTDLKQPIQVQAAVTDVPPNFLINNNQPVTLNPGTDTGTLPVVINTNVPPGTYNVVLRGTAPQVPYAKDPMAKQKQPTNIIYPSTPLSITVLPKAVATVTAMVPNPNFKVGTPSEVVVKVQRINDYAGELKVQLVLPQGTAGIAADEVVIP